METLEKLRASIRAADKVSRDAQTRYREQVCSLSLPDTESIFSYSCNNVSSPERVL